MCVNQSVPPDASFGSFWVKTSEVFPAKLEKSCRKKRKTEEA